MSGHRALDLYAGTGWGVAIQRLGAQEHGVEIMPEAIATREANGMETVYTDVWDAHLAEDLEFDTLIASPPCQAYSAAGNGAGRKALDDVLETLERLTWMDLDDLREWSLALGDERIGHVLVPLHYIWRFQPDYVALEQVPTVLPVWKAYIPHLEEMGYSVHVSVMRSEQYGVPQTRRRAILMARKTHLGPVAPPIPTHSRYYERDPKRLDAGVLPWVSMAEALGSTDRPTDSPSGADSHGRRQRDGRMGAVWPAGASGDLEFALVSNYSDGSTGERGRRMSDQPAPTITSKAERMKKEAA